MKKHMHLILSSFLVVIVGIGAGYLISNRMGSSTDTADVKVSANEAGILDEKTFKGDTAEGKLVDGGIGGEGAFHLERTGGPSKNVYLTSSVIDLTPFVGKNVKVWGETLASKKAGWLMDVIKIRLIE